MRQIPVQNFRPDHPDLGILIQVIRQRIQAAGENFNVGIEQIDILSPARLHADIIALGKSKVLRIPDDLHRRKQGCHHLRRPIGRGIVHHNNFHRARRRGVRQALKAHLQILLVVPAQNNHGNIHDFRA